MPELRKEYRSAARQLLSRVLRPGKLGRDGAEFTGRIILDLSIRGGRVETATVGDWKTLGELGGKEE